MINGAINGPIESEALAKYDILVRVIGYNPSLGLVLYIWIIEIYYTLFI